MDQKLEVFHQNDAGTSFLYRVADEGAQNNRSNIRSGFTENIGNILSGIKSSWKSITAPIPEGEVKEALVYDFAETGEKPGEGRLTKDMSELSYIDKKVISEAVDFIVLENEEVKNSMEKFSEKGSWGLWWDAKGLRNSSDKGDVLNKMEIYNVLQQNILACLQAVERNDRKAYELIVALYKKIEELERDAEIHADGKSKALCKLAKEFLDNKWKLDHNVKRVECVVLTNELKRSMDFADTLNQRHEKTLDSFSSLQEDYQTLHEDNQKLQEGNQNLQKSIDNLHEENLELKDTMRKVLDENQNLKDMISEVQERADQRLREVVEENRRSIEKLLIEMREMKIESK